MYKCLEKGRSFAISKYVSCIVRFEYQRQTATPCSCYFCFGKHLSVWAKHPSFQSFNWCLRHGYECVWFWLVFLMLWYIKQMQPIITITSFHICGIEHIELRHLQRAFRLRPFRIGYDRLARKGFALYNILTLPQQLHGWLRFVHVKRHLQTAPSKMISIYMFKCTVHIWSTQLLPKTEAISSFRAHSHLGSDTGGFWASSTVPTNIINSNYISAFGSRETHILQLPTGQKPSETQNFGADRMGHQGLWRLYAELRCLHTCYGAGVGRCLWRGPPYHHRMPAGLFCFQTCPPKEIVGKWTSASCLHGLYHIYSSCIPKHTQKMPTYGTNNGVEAKKAIVHGIFSEFTWREAIVVNRVGLVTGILLWKQKPFLGQELTDVKSRQTASSILVI